MATVLDCNKTKIARRVIEVFEYFGANHRSATVMDIVRRYGRPQSSTSELMTSLVELGLLYKDPMSRSYTPTPRLATLGCAAQPDYISDGRLYSYMNRLAQSTRHHVGLFGMVGTHVQLFRSVSGAVSPATNLEGGRSMLLSGSAAGLLLLSTLGADQSTRLVWRLNAEAEPDAKFNHAAFSERAATSQRQGHAVGEAGFVPGAQVAAVLLPCEEGDRPLVLGVVYPANARIASDALIATLKHGAGQLSLRTPGDYSAESAAIVRAI